MATTTLDRNALVLLERIVETSSDTTTRQDAARKRGLPKPRSGPEVKPPPVISGQ